MKRLLLSICAVATLASCSMDEVVSYDKGELIGFANPFVNKSTRATDPSIGATENNPFESFNVWGTADGKPIYTGDAVEGEVGKDDEGKDIVWTCNKKNYWIKGVEYDFAALANYGNATVGVGLDNGLPTSITGFDASGANVDLIYAKLANTITPTDDSYNTPVSLTFNHLLSKVKFTVINNSYSDAPEYSFNVSDITITGYKSGNATLGNDGWTWAPVEGSTMAAYTVDATNGITVDKDNTEVTNETELLLIPGTFTIEFKVNTIDGKIDGNDNVLNTKTYSYPSISALSQTLLVGTAYNFIINVSVGNEITFSVAANPSWTNANADGTTIL